MDCGLPGSSVQGISQARIQETRGQSLGWEDPLEKEVGTHSSILGWEIPWTEEPGRLQSMGLQKSQTGLSNLAQYLPQLLRNVGWDSFKHLRGVKTTLQCIKAKVEGRSVVCYADLLGYCEIRQPGKGRKAQG